MKLKLQGSYTSDIANVLLVQLVNTTILNSVTRDISTVIKYTCLLYLIKFECPMKCLTLEVAVEFSLVYKISCSLVYKLEVLVANCQNSLSYTSLTADASALASLVCSFTLSLSAYVLTFYPPESNPTRSYRYTTPV